MMEEKPFHLGDLGLNSGIYFPMLHDSGSNGESHRIPVMCCKVFSTDKGTCMILTSGFLCVASCLRVCELGVISAVFKD